MIDSILIEFGNMLMRRAKHGGNRCKAKQEDICCPLPEIRGQELSLELLTLRIAKNLSDNSG
jgi:hypothetical protein